MTTTCDGIWVKDKMKERGCHPWGCSHCSFNPKKYKQRLDDAIKKVFDELNALTPEQLKAEIEKHKDSARAKALYYCWNYKIKEPKQ